MQDAEPGHSRAKLFPEREPVRARLRSALREPWYVADEPDWFFEDELQREVHSEHPLWGDSYLLIARRQDQDDFAFLLPDGRIATVHLTFKGAREHGPWPSTVISPSIDDWLVNVAERDSRDWGDTPEGNA